MGIFSASTSHHSSSIPSHPVSLAVYCSPLPSSDGPPAPFRLCKLHTKHTVHYTRIVINNLPFASFFSAFAHKTKTKQKRKQEELALHERCCCCCCRRHPCAVTTPNERVCTAHTAHVMLKFYSFLVRYIKYVSFLFVPQLVCLFIVCHRHRRCHRPRRRLLVPFAGTNALTPHTPPPHASPPSPRPIVEQKVYANHTAKKMQDEREKNGTKITNKKSCRGVEAVDNLYLMRVKAMEAAKIETRCNSAVRRRRHCCKTACRYVVDYG